MDNVIGKEEVEGLREDIRSLTKAVMAVATVLYAGMEEQGGLSCLASARREVEYIHGRIDV